MEKTGRYISIRTDLPEPFTFNYFCWDKERNRWHVRLSHPQARWGGVTGVGLTMDAAVEDAFALFERLQKPYNKPVDTGDLLDKLKIDLGGLKI